VHVGLTSPDKLAQQGAVVNQFGVIDEQEPHAGLIDEACQLILGKYSI
jgi:hypothetical protein